MTFNLGALCPLSFRKGKRMIDAMIAQMDLDEPQWFIRWATGAELEAYAVAIEHEPIVQPRRRLKEAVAMRVFHRVLNVGLVCGQVVTP